MNPAYENLYQDLQADIRRCLELEHPEKDNVESCYWIARNYWNQLQAIASRRKFSSKADEIGFYREVKPAFASYIEYFSLLAEGLMFEPVPVPFPEDLNGKMTEADWVSSWQANIRDYWRAEEARGNRFYLKNQVFLDYCESGETGNDELYFLVTNSTGGDYTQRRSHNRDTELFTVHEEIWTTWQGFKRFKQYIKKKVNEPVNS